MCNPEMPINQCSPTPPSDRHWPTARNREMLLNQSLLQLMECQCSQAMCSYQRPPHQWSPTHHTAWHVITASNLGMHIRQSLWLMDLLRHELPCVVFHHLAAPSTCRWSAGCQWQEISLDFYCDDGSIEKYGTLLRKWKGSASQCINE